MVNFTSSRYITRCYTRFRKTIFFLGNGYRFCTVKRGSQRLKNDQKQVFLFSYKLNINLLPGVPVPLWPFFYQENTLLCTMTLKMIQMEGEIVVLKKEDLLEILEGFSKRISNNIQSVQPANNQADDNPKVKRLNSKKICEMLGISTATFERIQHELPVHKSKSGRIFAYEHDLIIYLFREYPPYFDYTSFKEYVKRENLVKYLSGVIK